MPAARDRLRRDRGLRRAPAATHRGITPGRRVGHQPVVAHQRRMYQRLVAIRFQEAWERFWNVLPR
jgi:hypothetical protein